MTSVNEIDRPVTNDLIGDVDIPLFANRISGMSTSGHHAVLVGVSGTSKKLPRGARLAPHDPAVDGGAEDGRP